MQNTLLITPYTPRYNFIHAKFCHPVRLILFFDKYNLILKCIKIPS
jgi:hypothetical protein